jgi:hypothetical protein
MITLRPAGERGRTRAEWLDSRHTFSFADYHDPRHMGFGALRVINDDRILAASGFGAHPHRDMEIVTWVLEGALEHRDSLGTGSVIRPGEVQRMSAGTGVVHSERNASSDASLRLLQIWIVPERRGIIPGYEQRAIDPERARNAAALIASRDGRDGSVTIHADVDLWVARLTRGAQVVRELRPGRRAWVQAARGVIAVGGAVLREGDGAAVEGEGRIVLQGAGDGEAEALLFDLA